MSSLVRTVALLRRVPEVDPLLCPECGVELQVVSVVTEPAPASGFRW